MRYLGHGIGHQNQDARWTSELDDEMDTDPDFEEDINSGGGPEENSDSQLQELRELAMKMISQPAGDDDEDVDSDDSEDSEGLDEDNLFFDGDSEDGEDSEDDKDSGDDDEFDFGPQDGEGEDGDDDRDGADFKEARSYF